MKEEGEDEEGDEKEEVEEEEEGKQEEKEKQEYVRGVGVFDRSLGLQLSRVAPEGSSTDFEAVS